MSEPKDLTKDRCPQCGKLEWLGHSGSCPTLMPDISGQTFDESDLPKPPASEGARECQLVCRADRLIEQFEQMRKERDEWRDARNLIANDLRETVKERDELREQVKNGWRDWTIIDERDFAIKERDRLRDALELVREMLAVSKRKESLDTDLALTYIREALKGG